MLPQVREAREVLRGVVAVGGENGEWMGESESWEKSVSVVWGPASAEFEEERLKKVIGDLERGLTGQLDRLDTASAIIEVKAPKGGW